MTRILIESAWSRLSEEQWKTLRDSLEAALEANGLYVAEERSIRLTEQRTPEEEADLTLRADLVVRSPNAPDAELNRQFNWIKGTSK